MNPECKVYQKELRSLGYGLPLYEPNPADYDHVRIGDVGIADRDGYFMRIFNCFARADHEINTRYGVPDDFEPLEDRCRLTKARQALEPGQWYKSQHVHQIEGGIDFSNTNNSNGVRVSFSVSSQQGAALLLKHSAERKDSACQILLQKYMLKHFESWEAFIRNIGVDFELQDMVFVTGHDLSANWATATNVHRTSRGSLSLTIGTIVATAATSFSGGSESTLDVPVRIGPNPYNPSGRHYLLESDNPSSGSAEPFKDQCLFLRGYRVAKRPIFPTKLRAAAGPGRLDTDGDEDTYAEVAPIGFDTDAESVTDEDTVDHNFALDLIFDHTNAEVAIVNESDVSLLAKVNCNHAKQLASQDREELLKIGLEIKTDFDSQLQKTAGTLKMLPLAPAASESAPSTILPYKGHVRDGKSDYTDDDFINQMPLGREKEAVFSSNKYPITDNERAYKDGKSNNPWVSTKKGMAVPITEKKMKEYQRYITGQVRDNATILPSTILSGHNSAICAVGFSPDGSCIASGSWDSTVRLWDAATGVQIGVPLRGHDDWVQSVVFSPDGRRIASGSSDRTIRIWDTVTGMQIGGPLRAHESWVQSVAFSPDGSRIASGSFDKTIRLWDAVTGMQVGKSLCGHDGPVESVAFSPGGSRIASGSEDQTIRLWDAVTEMQVGESLCGHESSVRSVAFSPNGSRIASGSLDKAIRLWDTVTGMQVGKPLCRHDDAVLAVAFSPNGSRIASVSSDDTVRLWDAALGVQVGEPGRGHCDSVQSVAFAPDGRRIVSGSHDGTVQIWKIPEKLPAGL